MLKCDQPQRTWGASLPHQPQLTQSQQEGGQINYGYDDYYNNDDDDDDFGDDTDDYYETQKNLKHKRHLWGSR